MSRHRMLEERGSEHCQQLRVVLTTRNGKHSFHLSGVATKQQRLNSWMIPSLNHNKRMIIRYEMVILSRNYLWECNKIHFFWKHSYSLGLICDKTGRNEVPATFCSVPVYCSYIIQSVTLIHYNSQEIFPVNTSAQKGRNRNNGNVSDLYSGDAGFESYVCGSPWFSISSGKFRDGAWITPKPLPSKSSSIPYSPIILRLAFLYRRAAVSQRLRTTGLDTNPNVGLFPNCTAVQPRRHYYYTPTNGRECSKP